MKKLWLPIIGIFSILNSNQMLADDYTAKFTIVNNSDASIFISKNGNDPACHEGSYCTHGFSFDEETKDASIISSPKFFSGNSSFKITSNTNQPITLTFKNIKTEYENLYQMNTFFTLK